MLHSLWFPVLIVFIGVVWLAAVVRSLGKPRSKLRVRQDNDDNGVPFVWGGDDTGGDDNHHGLH